MYVYILKSKTQNIVKIGFSDDYMERSVSADVKDMLGEVDYLNSYYIKVDNGRKLEQVLHTICSSYRIYKGAYRELFESDVIDALKVSSELFKKYNLELKRISSSDYKSNIYYNFEDTDSQICSYCGYRKIDTYQGMPRKLSDEYHLYNKSAKCSCRGCGKRAEAYKILVDQEHIKKADENNLHQYLLGGIKTKLDYDRSVYIQNRVNVLSEWN